MIRCLGLMSVSVVASGCLGCLGSGPPPSTGDSGVDASPCAQCEPWELCVGRMRCEPLALEFVSPSDGEVILEGQEFDVVVEARLAGALVDIGPIPAELIGGRTTLLSGQPKPFTMPAGRGPRQFRAGWAGGSFALRRVAVVGCDLSCAPWQECSPTVDGGVCTSSDLRIAWVSPAEGAAFRTSPVAATLQVTKADGGAVTLTSVPVSGALADFTGGGGTYSGELELLAPDGMKSFTAGWSADASSVLTLELDTAAPGVSVVVESRPSVSANAEPGFTGYWKKDETASVRVTVDGGRPATSSDFVVSWGGAVAASTACTGACAGNCRCFGVELASAPVVGMRATPAIQVRAIADSAGNLSAVQDAGIEVTRFRWASAMTLPTSSVPVLPVAVSPVGVVLWGAQDSAGTTPRLNANFPADGTSAWTAVTVGSVTAGPMLGTVDAWVATDNSVTSQLQRVALSSGNPGVPAACIGAGTFTGDLALGTAATEVPLGVRAGVLQGPVSGGCTFHNLANPTPMDNTSRPSLVVRSAAGNTTEAFLAYEGESRLWKTSLTGTTWSGAGSAPLPSGTQPRGLFFDGAGRAGGGGGVVGNGALFATDAAGLLDAGTLFVSTPAANASAPVVGAGFVLYGNSSGSLVKVGYGSAGFDAGSALTVAGGAGNLQATMPVLGEGALAYLLGTGGTLTVRRTADLSEAWNAPLASVSGTGGVSQAALDVYRTTAGAKDCSKPLGVLYVTTRTGSTATLRAILVDSKGLDAAAAWPKYQRDNANTGNISNPLSAWTCP